MTPIQIALETLNREKGELRTEIERLRAALQEIILRYDTDTDEMEGPARDMRAIARRALEPKT